MADKLQKATIAGGVLHFASSKEEVAIQVDLKHDDDEIIDKLHLVVRDSLGASVYRATWASPKAVESYEHSIKKTSEGPPADFTWKGQRLGGNSKWATPLGSPYQVFAVAELSKAPKPLIAELSHDKPEQLACKYAKKKEEPKPEPEPVWALRSLQVVASGVGSTSCTLRSAMFGELAGTDKNLFCYASGAETDVQIRWEFSKEHAGLTAGKLELFCAGQRRPIWQKDLDRAGLEKQSLALIDKDAVEWNDALTVLSSPYKLRLKVTGENAEQGFDAAWTYISVVVDRLELAWGPATFIPSEDPEKRPAFIRRDEALLLRELKESAPIEKPQDDVTEKEAFDQDAGPVVIEQAKSRKIELRSNIFYQNLSEWSDGTAFKKFQNLWANGPRIPLVARILVRNSLGNGVLAPLAIKDVKILWDWDDPFPGKEKGMATAKWLRWAFSRVDKAGTADSPPSTNCPGKYGGKRGGDHPIFPVTPGCNNGEIKAGIFPFEVAACKGVRNWAALSTPYRGEDKDWAGTTGVLFRPSRIAGDTYRVRAYLYLEGEKATYGHSVSSNDLWTAACAAGVPCAEAGSFEVWRRVDILRYYQKNGKGPSLDFGKINALFRAGRLRLNPPLPSIENPVKKLWASDAWNEALQELCAGPSEATNVRNKRVVAEFAEAQPADSGAAVLRKTWRETVHLRTLSALKAVSDSASGPLQERIDALVTASDGKDANTMAIPLWQLVSRSLSKAELANLQEQVTGVVSASGARDERAQEAQKKLDGLVYQINRREGELKKKKLELAAKQEEARKPEKLANLELAAEIDKLGKANTAEEKDLQKLKDEKKDAIETATLDLEKARKEMGQEKKPGFLAHVKDWIADSGAAADAISDYFNSKQVAGDFLRTTLLAGLAGRYIKENGLKKSSGLHLFHFSLPTSTYVDTKGGAFPMIPRQFEGDSADAGMQGASYVAAPPSESLLNITVPLKMPSAYFPAGLLEPCKAMAFVSAEMIADVVIKPDFDGMVACIANASAGAVLDRIDRSLEYEKPKQREEDESDPDRERAIDLWWNHAIVLIKGNPESAAKLEQQFADVLAVKLVEAPLSEGADKYVYLSLHRDLAAGPSVRVDFTPGFTSLSGTSRSRAGNFLRDLFATVQDPIGSVFIQFRDNAKGRARKEEVRKYLSALLEIVAQRVKINPAFELRSEPVGELDEREIVVSLDYPYKADKAAEEKKVRMCRVKFDTYSADITKNQIKQALKAVCEAISGDDAVTPPVLYVYFKDVKRSRHRRLKVVGYLDLILAALWNRNHTIADPSLELNALAAHELGHALFLEHAAPVDTGNAWRHVPGYGGKDTPKHPQGSCVMNYTNDTTEFCGLCALALRGWDIGSSGDGKFFKPGDPDMDRTKLYCIEGEARIVHDHNGEEEVVVAVAPPPPDPDAGKTWEFVGYHGTRSANRASLRAGLRPMESKWDPETGGELGPGFYCSTDYPTTCLYGAGIASNHRDCVDIWRVESSKAFATMTSRALNNDEQWARVPREACENVDYLTHALEIPAVQIKFNPPAYPHLRLTLFRQGMTLDAAYNDADKKVDPRIEPSSSEKSDTKEKSKPSEIAEKVASKLARPPARVVPTNTDGDCFFYAIAYHVKSSDEERAAFADGRRTYGGAPAEVLNGKRVREEIANELARTIYGTSYAEFALADDPLLVADNGARYQNLWNQLTNEGRDIGNWGDSLWQTIYNLPHNAAAPPAEGALVWGDIQFMWWAILRLYPDFTRVVVYHGGVEPQIFGAAGGRDIRLYHRGSHYEIVLGV